MAVGNPRIRYFRHERNHGPTFNVEFAREQARGKYFAWCGDYDYFAPDYLGRCVAKLEQGVGLLLANGMGAYHQGDGVVVYRGNVLHLDAPQPLRRVAHYLFKARDNPVFYGLYRRVAIATLPSAQHAGQQPGLARRRTAARPAVAVLVATAMGFRAARQYGKHVLLRTPLLGPLVNRALDPY